MTATLQSINLVPCFHVIPVHRGTLPLEKNPATLNYAQAGDSERGHLSANEELMRRDRARNLDRDFDPDGRKHFMNKARCTPAVRSLMGDLVTACLESTAPYVGKPKIPAMLKDLNKPFSWKGNIEPTLAAVIKNCRERTPEEGPTDTVELEVLHDCGADGSRLSSTELPRSFWNRSCMRRFNSQLRIKDEATTSSPEGKKLFSLLSKITRMTPRGK